MIGDSLTSAIYQKALDGTWQRQKAITNNIANSETPNYKALEVDFETELKNAMQRLTTNSNENRQSQINTIMDSDIQVESYDRSSNRLDDNNVDLDAENIDMSRTQIQYYYLIEGFNSSYSRIKYAINEG